MHFGIADTEAATGGFLDDGQLARFWLRHAIVDLHAREPVAATDRIEALVRHCVASRPNAPLALCDAAREVLRGVITNRRPLAAPQ